MYTDQHAVETAQEVTETINFEDVAGDKTFNPVSLTPKMKTLHLMYQSCCGCGCDDPTDITRIVPETSSLQDGDIVTDYVIGDRDGWL